MSARKGQQAVVVGKAVMIEQLKCVLHITTSDGGGGGYTLSAIVEFGVGSLTHIINLDPVDAGPLLSPPPSLPGDLNAHGAFVDLELLEVGGGKEVVARVRSVRLACGLTFEAGPLKEAGLRMEAGVLVEAGPQTKAGPLAEAGPLTEGHLWAAVIKHLWAVAAAAAGEEKPAVLPDVGQQQLLLTTDDDTTAAGLSRRSGTAGEEEPAVGHQQLLLTTGDDIAAAGHSRRGSAVNDKEEPASHSCVTTSIPATGQTTKKALRIRSHPSYFQLVAASIELLLERVPPGSPPCRLFDLFERLGAAPETEIAAQAVGWNDFANCLMSETELFAVCRWTTAVRLQPAGTAFIEQYFKLCPFTRLSAVPAARLSVSYVPQQHVSGAYSQLCLRTLLEQQPKDNFNWHAHFTFRTEASATVFEIPVEKLDKTATKTKKMTTATVVTSCRISFELDLENDQLVMGYHLLLADDDDGLTAERQWQIQSQGYVPLPSRNKLLARQLQGHAPLLRKNKLLTQPGVVFYWSKGWWP